MLSDVEVSCLALLGSAEVGDKLKRHVLLHCPSAVIKKVLQVVRDVVFGQISIPEEDRLSLRRYRARIHRIAKAERSEQVKRRQLAQKGSLVVLTALLNSALPALSSQLTSGDEPASTQ